MSLGSWLVGAFGNTNPYQYQTGGQYGDQYNSAIANEQKVADQYGQMANGQGPNPAQEQLKQNTNAAIAKEAGAVGSVKGLNPALAQRLALQNSAAMTQHSAGQAATLQAEQELAARRAQAGIYGNIANQNAAMLNSQNAINSGVSASNTALVNQAGTGIFNGFGALGSFAAGSGGGGGSSGGGAAAGATGGGGGGSGSFAGSAGAESGAMGDMAYAAHGGIMEKDLPHYSLGSILPLITMFLSKGGNPNGDEVKAMVSPGEKIMDPNGDVETVPGKAKVKGDSRKNDTVMKDLREDSVVFPRSKSSNKENMIDFIKHMQVSSDKKSHLEQLLAGHQEIRQKLDEVNEKLGKWRPNR